MAASPTKPSKSSKKKNPKAPKKTKEGCLRLANHPWIRANIIARARVYCNVLGRFIALTDFGLAIIVRSPAGVLDYIDQELPRDIDYSVYANWWWRTKDNYKRSLLHPTTYNLLLRQYQDLCLQQQQHHEQQFKANRNIMSELSNVIREAAVSDANTNTTSRNLIAGEVEKTKATKTMWGKIAALAQKSDAAGDGKLPRTYLDYKFKFLAVAILGAVIAVSIHMLFSNNTATNNTWSGLFSNMIPAMPAMPSIPGLPGMPGMPEGLTELKKKVMG
eukprot:CAMPEP_0113458610 /NCGR_PEP_ID=MMETSP0014_2-20120614/10012_1 /TAXON_ID=2857 /ORGANISM="Nitzschia sp." /LENGTH=274 /DNA_ID=CAMNT_0000350141 /DNA_START=2223 /DNA_END=3047 /DNA_ORIENTATION=- /assembly_acc=CAM_ASM_000159